MMDSFLKPYRLVAQTLSPVHIGAGVKLGKADFILQNGQAHIIDENKLLAWIVGQPNAEQLALMLADDLHRVEGGIAKFLQERFRGNLTQIVAYSLPYQGNPKDVSAFIKTAQQQPYIPGSSMKGVLRSGLLRGRMLDDVGLRAKAVKAIERGVNSGRFKTNSDEIQANLFASGTDKWSKWPNFDINRMLVLRDSDALAVDALEMMAVKTLSVQFNNSLAQKSYEIYIEAVRARQLIQLPAIWQEHLLSEKAQLLGLQKLESLIAFLPTYCRRVSQNLLTQEQKFYARHGRKDLADWFEKQLNLLAKSDEDVFILPMGWGSGYDAKTITDLLGAATFKIVVNTYKNTWGLGKPGRRKDAEWLGMEDSPKSRKIVERPKGAEPMGWVALRFVPDADTDWLAERREVLKAFRPEAIAFTPQPVPSSMAVLEPLAAQVSMEAVRPAVSLVAQSKSAIPAQKPLIAKFTATPRQGDRFEGIVFGDEREEVMLEIPGLDPDTEAYAVLFRQENSLIGKVKEGQKLVCEVRNVQKEKKYWRVECRLG